MHPPVDEEHHNSSNDGAVADSHLHCRLDDLSDDLAVHILSFLPFDSLARTSLLSRRWRSLWTLSPRLEFILLHPDHFFQLNSFVEPFLSRRPYNASQLQELDVTCTNGTPEDLPEVLAGCVGLRTLRLCRADMRDVNLSAVLSGLPRLSHLSLRSCVGMGDLNVKSSVMTHLKLAFLKVWGFKIDAPALVSLTIVSVVVRSSFAVRAPRVRCLSVGEDPDVASYTVLELLFCITKTARLNNFLIDMNQFSNLRMLSIRADLDNVRHIVIVAAAIRQATLLTQLQIAVGKSTSLSNREGLLKVDPLDYWRMTNLNYYESLALTDVLIKGCRGDDLEMEFLKFVIRKGSFLQRLVVHCKDARAKLRGMEYLKAEWILPASPTMEIEWIL